MHVHTKGGWIWWRGISAQHWLQWRAAAFGDGRRGLQVEGSGVWGGRDQGHAEAEGWPPSDSNTSLALSSWDFTVFNNPGLRNSSPIARGGGGVTENHPFHYSTLRSTSCPSGNITKEDEYEE